MLVIVSAIGWGMNLYKFIQTAGPISTWTAEDYARFIGVFNSDVGSVMGFVPTK